MGNSTGLIVDSLVFIRASVKVRDTNGPLSVGTGVIPIVCYGP